MNLLYTASHDANEFGGRVMSHACIVLQCVREASHPQLVLGETLQRENLYCHVENPHEDQ